MTYICLLFFCMRIDWYWNGCADGKLQRVAFIFTVTVSLFINFFFVVVVCSFFASCSRPQSHSLFPPPPLLLMLSLSFATRPFQRFRIKTHMLRCFCPQKQEINQRRWSMCSQANLRSSRIASVSACVFVHVTYVCCECVFVFFKSGAPFFRCLSH